jgi:hypothetical protein
MSQTDDVPNSIDDDESNNHLSLVEAMKAADSIRTIFLKRKDPNETEALLPPGSLEGSFAFITTGLLFTPLRSTILKMTGPRGSFQSFVDLIVTPFMAVASAQVGLVVGSLYGSSYYLERVATVSVNETKATSFQVGQDTNNTIADELCQELLSITSSPSSSSQEVTFGSWDPRTKTMESLFRALENCQKKEAEVSSQKTEADKA